MIDARLPDLLERADLDPSLSVLLVAGRGERSAFDELVVDLDSESCVDFLPRDTERRIHDGDNRSIFFDGELVCIMRSDIEEERTWAEG